MSPAANDRSRRSDRALKVIGLVAGAFLIAFITWVVLSPRAAHRATFPVSAPAALRAGTPAPDFSLPRLGGGPPVTLASYRGTPVIVNFFASWCPHCRAELAAIATADRHAAGRVQVVGVDANDTSTAAVEGLLAGSRASYPVGVDNRAQVATHYLLTALPVTYFIDARGRVAGVAFGSVTVATLDRWVRHLTAPAHR